MPELLPVAEPPPTAPAAPVLPPVAGHSRRRLRPRTRRRFWAALALALLAALAGSPASWHALARAALVRQAARQGCELTIARLDGGPFETLHLTGLRLRRPGGTDLRAARAQLAFAWPPSFLRSHSASWLRSLVVSGVSGTVEFCDSSGDAFPAPRPARGGVPARWLDRLAAGAAPASFAVQADDLTLQRGRYHLRALGLRVTGERAAAGSLRVRQLEISGPGFRNTFSDRHGQTFWQAGRLTFTNVDGGAGLLASATFDGSRLAARHRLLWDGALVDAAGGDVRAQGSVNFARPRVALEVAGSLRGMSVAALARFLGLGGPAGGTVEQGSFSFRGDPEDWSSAELWLAGRATDFRWNARACDRLELQGLVTHRRVEITRLELRQSRNRVSLQGEGPLPGPFTGRVDARLDDLRALAQLLGPRCPDLAGRMSVNGQLTGVPGQPEVSGYLNVEGSGLALRGVPLDYLRATLTFADGACRVADAQAGRGQDFFTGQATLALARRGGCQGRFRVAVADPSMYTPLLAGWWNPGPAAGFIPPVRAEGFFCGPGTAGETLAAVFSTAEEPFAGLTPWPVVPSPMVTALRFDQTLDLR